MEDNENSAIFESLNLSPHLFINEVLNFVDDLTDKAFNYFLEGASAQMKTEATDRADDLNRGVAYIQNLVRLTLENRLKKWEEYSLRFCFRVLEGFSLPRASPSSPDDLPDLDALADTELDAQLNSLRDKLTLNLLSLAKNCVHRKNSLYQAISVLDLLMKHYSCMRKKLPLKYYKLATTTSEFHAKLEKLNRRSMEELQSIRSKRLCVPQQDMLPANHGKDMFNGKLDDL